MSVKSFVDSFRLSLNHAYFQFSIKTLEFLGEAMSEIKILYKGKWYETEIEDISPEELQECFDLPKPPKFLLVESENKLVNSRHWRSKLKEGSICRIKEGTNNVDSSGEVNIDTNESSKKATGFDNNFRKIVLHSLIASTAVYKMEHSEDDEKLLQQYLYEQIENHYFEYIIPSKHGVNFFLIAKEIDANRIYIAFRGSQDLVDWEHNLQVRLCYSFMFLCLFCSCYLINIFLQSLH